MQFNTRSEFISAASSEKITLAQIDAKARLYVFSGPTSNIYSKVVPYFVAGIKQDDTDLTSVANLGAVVEGTFYYDIKESTLYVRTIDDTDPTTVEIIATYRFFYANKGIALPHDLADISEDVNYEGRIVSSPGYKHKIGIDQALTSLVGEGTLHLKNLDGGLDGKFDKLVFENQPVTIYSWNPDLQPSDARVIYRGQVTNKSFDGVDVRFKIKDEIFNLLDSPSLGQYTADDDVADSAQGQFKRRVYGRVDGLRCQSTSQIAEGIPLTGTVSFSAKSNVNLTIKAIVDFTTVETNAHGDLNVGDEVYVGQVEKEGGYLDYVTALNISTVQDIERLNLGVPVDRDGFIMYDPNGSVAVVFDLFGAGNPYPAWAVASSRIINVTVPSATQASLATALAATLTADSQFSATVVAVDDVEVTHTVSGAIDAAEYQGEEVGFSVSSVQNGVTTYEVTVKTGWAGSNPTPTVDSQLNRLTLLNGVGTEFLSETVQGDKIIALSQELTISKVIDDETIIIDETPQYSAAGIEVLLLPERGSTLKNRTYLAAGHLCAEVTHTIVSVPQFNRVVLNSTEGLFGGDFIEFSDTSERLEIKTVAPGNLIVLQQNMVLKPAVATTAVRKPIQEVYLSKKLSIATDFTINNTGSSCGLTLSDDVEFNIAKPKVSPVIGTFVRNDRNISISTTEVSLQDIFSPGDWVKPDGITYSNYYKIVNINSTSLDIATPFNDSSIVDTVEYKSPDYLTDDSIVSVNILGKTVDGTAAGLWISNAAQVQKDLIEDIGITTYNTASFTEGELDSPQLISMAIPESFTAKTLPKVKDLVDKINKSVHSSLTLDNDLLLKFKTLNVTTGEDLQVIKDSDVINWKITATNGKTFRRVFTKYRLTDVDLSTLEAGNKALDFNNEFVQRYIGTNKVDDINLYLYKERDARISTHRHSYYNQLGVATLTLTTDLRLENVEIGEVVIADFEKLYSRLGDADVRKKVMLVIGKTLNGQKTELILSDLGNTFNTSSYITPNAAPDYTAATEDEKLIYGYITDNQGITDNDEDTAGVHLIS